MNLRETLEQAKTWTLTTKSKGKVVEFTLKAKGIKPVTFEIYGQVSLPKGAKQ